MDKSSIKIILIDDDPQSRESLSLHLVEEGYQVLLMTNIRISYPDVKKAMPDLIMISVSKPKVYYYAFVKNLKESNWGKSIPLMIFDEDDTNDEPSSSFKVISPEYILRKPLDFREIDKKLKKLLHQRFETLHLEGENTLEINTTEIVDEANIEHLPPKTLPEEIIHDEETISKKKGKTDITAKDDDIVKKTIIISKAKRFPSPKKFILYTCIFLLFMGAITLLYLKYATHFIHKIPDQPDVYSETIRDLLTEEKVSIPDQLKYFKDNLRSLEEKGIKNYLADEFKRLEDMVSNFETKANSSGFPSVEIMKEVIAIRDSFESLENQLDLVIIKEKAKAYAAIKDAENIIDMIKESKLDISSQKELQDAQSEYFQAKKLIESSEPDFKKITTLVLDSVQKLMNLPEYNVLKLQDSEEIKLRKNADLFFDLEMYVFPEENNALKSYQQILKLHPTNQHALDRVNKIKNIIKEKGDRFYEIGNFPGAIVHYKEYIKLEPDDRIIRERIKKIEKKKQTNFFELITGVNPFLWIILIGFAVAIYKYLPLVIYDIKNAYIIVGMLIVLLMILMLFI
ncbi:hypothetical protein KKB18_11970 [bacterium]|nr:hypothetical protein [bacterium]